MWRAYQEKTLTGVLFEYLPSQWIQYEVTHQSCYSVGCVTIAPFAFVPPSSPPKAVLAGFNNFAIASQPEKPNIMIPYATTVVILVYSRTETPE